MTIFLLIKKILISSTSPKKKLYFKAYPSFLESYNFFDLYTSQFLLLYKVILPRVHLLSDPNKVVSIVAVAAKPVLFHEEYAGHR